MDHVTKVVHRLTNDVENAAESSLSHRNCDRAAGVDSLHTADHAVSGQHRNRAYSPFAEMLLNFSDNFDALGNFEALGNNFQGLVNRRQIVLELDVNDWTNDLNDAAGLTTRICTVWRSHTVVSTPLSDLFRRKSGRFKSQTRYHSEFFSQSHAFPRSVPNVGLRRQSAAATAL